VHTAPPTGQSLSQPNSLPTSQPSALPTILPSGEPTSHPTTQPTGQPTIQPAGQPSSQPSSQPTGEPTSQPTSIYHGFTPEYYQQLRSDEVQTADFVDHYEDYFAKENTLASDLKANILEFISSALVSPFELSYYYIELYAFGVGFGEQNDFNTTFVAEDSPTCYSTFCKVDMLAKAMRDGDVFSDTIDGNLWVYDSTAAILCVNCNSTCHRSNDTAISFPADPSCTSKGNQVKVSGSMVMKSKIFVAQTVPDLNSVIVSSVNKTEITVNVNVTSYEPAGTLHCAAFVNGASLLSGQDVVVSEFSFHQTWLVSEELTEVRTGSIPGLISDFTYG
jgi:hypothetical protein